MDGNFDFHEDPVITVGFFISSGLIFQQKYADALQHDKNEQNDLSAAELPQCEAQIDAQLTTSISSKVRQPVETVNPAESSSDLEFGDGISDLLANIEASPPQSLAPIHSNSTDVSDEEDFSDIPIDQSS